MRLADGSARREFFISLVAEIDEGLEVLPTDVALRGHLLQLRRDHLEEEFNTFLRLERTLALFVGRSRRCDLIYNGAYMASRRRELARLSFSQGWHGGHADSTGLPYLGTVNQRGYLGYAGYLASAENPVLSRRYGYVDGVPGSVARVDDIRWILGARQSVPVPYARRDTALRGGHGLQAFERARRFTFSDGLLETSRSPVVPQRYVYADDVLESVALGDSVQWVPRVRPAVAEARYPPLRTSAWRDHRDGADAG